MIYELVIPLECNSRYVCGVIYWVPPANADVEILTRGERFKTLTDSNTLSCLTHKKYTLGHEVAAGTRLRSLGSYDIDFASIPQNRVPQRILSGSSGEALLFALVGTSCYYLKTLIGNGSGVGILINPRAILYSLFAFEN